jgi:hypothetical protein
MEVDSSVIELGLEAAMAALRALDGKRLPFEWAETNVV